MADIIVPDGFLICGSGTRGDRLSAGDRHPGIREGASVASQKLHGALLWRGVSVPTITNAHTCANREHSLLPTLAL